MSTSTDHVLANYEAFKRHLPDLLTRHHGKFALMRDEAVVEVFDTASDAVKTGRALFQDGKYSVQEITGSPVNLGYFSYAVH